MAETRHAGILANAQDLHYTNSPKSLEVASAELTDPAVVRLLVTGEHQEGQILIANALNLREETTPAQ
jgi:hypothetical protein